MQKTGCQGRGLEPNKLILVGLRCLLEASEGEEISTRELRENVEGKNDTIGSVLNELARQGRVKLHKKGKQKVLWSLIRHETSESNESAKEPAKTGSRKFSQYARARKPVLDSPAGNRLPKESEPPPLERWIRVDGALHRRMSRGRKLCLTSV